LIGAIAQIEPQVAESNELATQDYGDKANSFNTKESLLQQLSQNREVLGAVEGALRRIDDGTYGRCAECGEPIPAKRLEAMPWAALCLYCQRLNDERTQAQPAVHGGVSSRVV
jgi:DnaK suppressor protein